MPSNNYVVGKGRLYFCQFAQGTKAPPAGAGFKYFGNTPTLEISRAVTTLDHFDSEGGVKVKDDSIDIETNINGKFSTDNINSNNLALWFGGNTTIINQTTGSALTETILGAVPDNFYQIGQTLANPAGLRGVTTFSATMGSGGTTPLVKDVDYSFDPVSGLFYIIPGGAVSGAGATVNLTYSLTAAVQEVVIEQGQAVFGALRFVSNNPKGDQRDGYWPYVKLSADGAFAFKGDTWQTAAWNFEALKLSDTVRRSYITKRAAA